MKTKKYGEIEILETSGNLTRIKVAYSNEFPFWVRSDELMTVHRKIRGTYSDAPCKENCWRATGFVCVCSCGGHNHRIAYDLERQEEYQALQQK
jgi:hypothetical protein